MVFSSLIFLFAFLPITLILYFLVPSKYKNLLLLILSLVFYAWDEPIYVILMILSMTFNYFMGIDIALKNRDAAAKKRSLILAVVINLLILGFFKYYGFLVETINGIFSSQIPYKKLALPIGISFYTFQTLSYIIDVYRKRVPVQKNILNFGLYVALFPQLIAGPIVKYVDVAQQIENRKVTVNMFGSGVMFFIRGLAKKVLLANNVGLLFDAITGSEVGEVSVLGAWLGAIAYTFQIYFDFGGYSDMAIGLGRMFGFDFMRNFNYPYISKSVTEFWRRWHISLSTWFREYVYIPLGGNRVSIPRHVFNIMIVWLLTGLWHGASWNFVIWGLYYGIILLIEKYFLQNILFRLPNIVRHLLTMLAVVIGWVFFFSPDMSYAISYIGVMFGAGSGGIVGNMGMYYLISNWVILLICAIGSTPYVHAAFDAMILRTEEKHITTAVVIYAAMFLASVAYLVSATYNPFLYFRF